MADWYWTPKYDPLEPAYEVIKAVDGGVVSEYEVHNAAGGVIGYFAYGSWDPSLPYQGEEQCSKN